MAYPPRFVQKLEVTVPRADGIALTTANVRLSYHAKRCDQGRPKFQVTIPKNVRDAVGLKVGGLVEASVGREGIVLRQKVLIDKPVSLARQLEESEAAVKAGVLGPFKSAGAAMRAVKAQARRADRTVRR